MSRFELNETAKKLALKACPGYTGRTVCGWTAKSVSNSGGMWSEGHRTVYYPVYIGSDKDQEKAFARIMELHGLKQGCSIPAPRFLDGNSIKEFPTKEGVIAYVGYVNAGARTYISLVVHPDDQEDFEARPDEIPELSEAARAVLTSVYGLKSSYRQQEYRRIARKGWPPYDEATRELKQVGLVGSTNALTDKGKKLQAYLKKEASCAV